MADFDLDHAGVAVSDLERGRAAFARLGFRLTARSLHSGSPTPGAPVVPWGSGNHCAMLRAGYLEVIGLTDPARFSSVKDMVARYEGAHIVALGCDDADAGHALLVERGVAADAPRSLERDAAFGEHDEATRRARFRNVYVDRSRFTEGRFLVIQHLTREVIWQPHLLAHPNGATALTEVWFCAPDPAASAEKLGRAFGASPRPLDDGRIALDLRRGNLYVLDPARWAALGPGGPTPPMPAPVALGFTVESLARTGALLAGNGVEPIARDDALWIAPADACGAALRFSQEISPT